MIVQLVVGVIDILLSNANSSFSEITSFIISVFSFPLSLISRNLPFYSGEGLLVTLMFWGLNLIIQSSAIYVLARFYKRLKKT
jgi:hypothetical protein